MVSVYQVIGDQVEIIDTYDDLDSAIQSTLKHGWDGDYLLATTIIFRDFYGHTLATIYYAANGADSPALLLTNSQGYVEVYGRFPEGSSYVPGRLLGWFD